MPLLTSRELADLRSDILDLLPDTCQIQTPIEVNTGGYVEPGWGTAVASVACRFDPDTPKYGEIIADKESHITRYIVTLPYNTPVEDGQRLVFSGNNYEILQIHDAHSDNATRRLRVSIIRGG